MRNLFFQYHMLLSFSHSVNRHHFTLKCLPVSNIRQQIIECNYRVNPAYLGGEEKDSYGNNCIYGLIDSPHTQFTVDVSGKTLIDDTIHLLTPKAYRLGMFKYQTELTRMGAELLRMHKKTTDNNVSNEDILDRTWKIMKTVYENISYKSGITGVSTTAEEAAMYKCGVCQDYAHIMLALLRFEYIPCRYVAGMMVGEGASHAWVEVCDNDKWIAFDPTHNRMVDDSYITISYGRDARDCAINQGYFQGNTEQTQEIHVVVEDVENE